MDGAMTPAHYVADSAKASGGSLQEAMTAAAASLDDRRPLLRRHEDDRIRQRQHVVLLARLGEQVIPRQQILLRDARA